MAPNDDITFEENDDDDDDEESEKFDPSLLFFLFPLPLLEKNRFLIRLISGWSNGGGFD